MSLKPKKFDLVHQTVSPREMVGSGDETRRCLGVRVVKLQQCLLSCTPDVCIWIQISLQNVFPWTPFVLWCKRQASIMPTVYTTALCRWRTGKLLSPVSLQNWCPEDVTTCSLQLNLFFFLFQVPCGCSGWSVCQVCTRSNKVWWEGEYTKLALLSNLSYSSIECVNS